MQEWMTKLNRRGTRSSFLPYQPIDPIAPDPPGKKPKKQVFATQWHPERSLFEWGPTEDINHSPAAVRIVQLVADALVRSSRLSRHRFASAEAEAAASIYNAQVVYRERVSTPQLYIFPPYGQRNATVAEKMDKRLRGSGGGMQVAASG